MGLVSGRPLQRQGRTAARLIHTHALCNTMPTMTARTVELQLPTAQENSPPVTPPAVWSPDEWSPDEWSPQHWSPDEWSPQHWSPEYFGEHEAGDLPPAKHPSGGAFWWQRDDVEPTRCLGLGTAGTTGTTQTPPGRGRDQAEGCSVQPRRRTGGGSAVPPTSPAS